VAASRQVATWDWTKVQETAEKMGAVWHIVPTGGQDYNDQAERLIRTAKEVPGEHHGQDRLTLGELNTVVAKAAQMVNSRSIARDTGDPETGGLIMPLHLMLA
jgi:hypothetical protein